MTGKKIGWRNFSNKSVISIFSIFVLLFAAIGIIRTVAPAQGIRLRSRIDPSSLNSTLKYADLYGD